MVFILDQALRRTLTGTSGRHSMYDFICWEYLVGKEVSPMYSPRRTSEIITRVITLPAKTRTVRIRTSHVSSTTVLFRAGAFQKLGSQPRW